VGFRGADLVVGEALGFGVGVGLESAPITAARKEPAAAKFSRVPLDHHPVAHVGGAAVMASAPRPENVGHARSIAPQKK
jgi:hypothetical protein